MQKLGYKGERLAVSYLQDRGYKILTTNFRSRFGEIDVIARQGQVLCFIEVKLRRSAKCGRALESVPHYKRRKIWQTAAWYMGCNGISSQAARFDVVAIDDEGKAQPTISLVQNAFDLAL